MSDPRKGDDGRPQWRQNARARSIRLYRYRRRLAKGFEGFVQLLVDDVGINHRCGEIGMSEHLLHEPDLPRFSVEVCSERMA